MARQANNINIENNARISGYSTARLESYYLKDNDSIQESLINYYWNIALCRELYPALQLIEVTLRNQLSQVIQCYTGDAGWLVTKKILKQPEQDALIQVQTRTAPNRRQESNHLISELNFGFWTNLFDARYEQVLWPKLLSVVFPNLPRKHRTRSYIQRHFDEIRRLRNRVFHHQRIIHWQNLRQRYFNLLDGIRWINQTIEQDLRILDQFLITHETGKEGIKNKLMQPVSEESYEFIN